MSYIKTTGKDYYSKPLLYHYTNRSDPPPPPTTTKDDQREDRTGTGAELRDKEDGRVISTTCTDVSLLGLAHQEGLVGIIDVYPIVLQ